MQYTITVTSAAAYPTKEEGIFTDFVFKYLKENKGSMRIESYYTYRSLATKLLRFRNPIRFSDLTEQFVNEYKEWCLNVGNNENTTSKSLRTLRTFVNVAMRYGHIDKNPFQYIRIKKVTGKRDFLTKEEFNNLYDSLGKYDGIKYDVLKCFLFSCTTGLRYTDMRRIGYGDIRDGMIQLTMHKTSLPVTIPLSNKAQALLQNDGSGSLFKTYCNKVTNRVLKGIINDCGIGKKVTFHVARHTFATISITLGMPIEVISKLLGHTDLKTTQVYAKIVDSRKIDEMRKWNF